MFNRFLIALILGASLIWGCAAMAVPTQAGLTVFGKPKYPADFKQFDFVSKEAQKGGDIYLAVPGSFDTLNPFIISGVPAAGAAYTFATLLKPSLDELSVAYPYLAECYEISNDKQSITFYVRAGAKFHDGTSINPEDVIFSFETLTTKGSPVYRTLFSDVTKVEKSGERGVKFTFKTSKNPELPILIATHLPIISKAYYTKNDFSKVSLLASLGSGPYRYTKIEAGRSVTLVRVKDWWGESLPVNQGFYNFDTIKYDYYRDPNIAFEAFKQGKIDFRQEVTAKFWATGYDFPAFKQGNVVKHEIPHKMPTGTLGFFFNTRKPFLNDPLVREALFYVFDFEWINKNLFFDSYIRLDSFFFNSPYASHGVPVGQELEILMPFKDKLPERLFKEPFTLPKTDGSGNIRTHLQRAKALLEKAGYAFEKGKLISKENSKPVNLEIIANSPAMERVSLNFIQNLKALGIQARFRLLDSSQYEERINSFDFDIVAGGVTPAISNPGNEQKELWGSEASKTPGSQNYCGVVDPVIDALIEKVINAPSYEDLIVYSQALDRVLLWNRHVLPKWGSAAFRYAYWNKFKYPEKSPAYGIGIDTWWIDPEMQTQISKAQGR